MAAGIALGVVRPELASRMQMLGDGFIKAIRAAGPERCVISTDLGQTTNPALPPASRCLSRLFLPPDSRRTK
jgi:hypothetical protein